MHVFTLPFPIQLVGPPPSVKTKADILGVGGVERVLDFQRHGLNQALLLRDLLRGQTHGSSSGHPERAAARADERLCITGVSGPGQTWSTRRLRGQRWWPGWGRSRRVSRAGCVCGWRCEVRGLTWDSPYIHFPHGASESITSESTPRAGPTGSYTPMGLGTKSLPYVVFLIHPFSVLRLQLLLLLLFLRGGPKARRGYAASSRSPTP